MFQFQLLLLIKYLHLSNKIHCVKRIQIRRFYLVCIFPYSVQIRPEKRLNKKERYKEEHKMKKNCFWKLWRNCVRLLQKKKKKLSIYYFILFCLYRKKNYLNGLLIFVSQISKNIYSTLNFTSKVVIIQ